MDVSVRSLEEFVLNIVVHDESQLRGGCNDWVCYCKGVETRVHDEWGENNSNDEPVSNRPHNRFVPCFLSQLLLFKNLCLTFGPVHSGIDIFKLHPMEQRQSRSGCCPIWNLFEFPQERHSRKEHINVVIDPVVAFHESVPAFVSVETMFNLKPWDDKIDQVQKQEKRKIIVWFSTNWHFALWNDAFFEGTWRNVKIDEKVDRKKKNYMKDVLDYEKVVEFTQRRQFFSFKRHVFWSVFKSKTKEKVLEPLV